MIGNSNFAHLNQYLGWGDPNQGLWTIGLEEAGIYTAAEIEALQGVVVSEVNKAPLSHDGMANTTASLVSKINVNSQGKNYRNEFLYRPGSQVFSGNLWAIGKPSLASWLSEFEPLFGLTRKDYLSFRSTEVNSRFAAFKALRKQANPQAIICLGKTGWDDFKKCFVSQAQPDWADPALDVEVYRQDRVILTGHFSFGHFPHAARDKVVYELKQWQVKIPTAEMV